MNEERSSSPSSSSSSIEAQIRSDDYYVAALQDTIQRFQDLYYYYLDSAAGDDRPSRKAVTEMKESNSILFPNKRIGELPGVCTGYQFYSRGEMAAVGFHSHGFKDVDYILQDDYLTHKGYEKYAFPIATSIVVMSTQYKKEQVVYISPSVVDFADKNLALKNNEEQRIPVRLTRKHPDKGKSFGMIYTYDGLYSVNVVRGYSEEGSSSLMYHLRRLEGQRLTINQDRFLRGHPFGDLSAIAGLCSKDITVVDPERIPIIATNEVDDEPYPFTDFRYSKSLVFAENVKKPEKTEGCNCQGSCTDSERCPCAEPDTYEEAGR